MDSRTTKDALEEMKHYAELHYPNEACGIIISTGNKFKLIDCKNISNEPRHNFIIDPADWLKASQQGTIEAYWHSHVNLSSAPSGADRDSCGKSKKHWFIIGITKNGDETTFDGPTLLKPSDEIEPLLGRVYVAGVHDCYTLVADYYKTHESIQMGSYTHYALIEDWCLKGHSFFEEHFEEEGFVRIKEIDKEPMIGDVILMKTTVGNPNHLGVYVGNGRMIHHTYGRLSDEVVYGGYWTKHTVAFLRHKSKC